MIFGDYSEWTVTNIIVRILASVILGSIIGIDRGRKHKGAGTKTNVVVCLGATLVMLTEQYIQVNYPGLANMTRMSAQVISGVGFLGVGTIIISDHKVRGLTTAAMLWTCACIGLATGIGFLDGSILITLALLLALRFLPYIEQLMTKNSRYYSVYFDIVKPQTMHKVIAKLKENDYSIEDVELYKSDVKEMPTTVFLTLRSKTLVPDEELYALLDGFKDVSSVDIL